MAELSCPTCGKKFQSPQGLGAHRGRAHGYRSKNPQSIRSRELKQRKAAERYAPKPLPEVTKRAAKKHLTTIQWTELVDDNGSGRRLFVDENDDWWVAKKLDI